jgi:hypothetical protein
MAFGVHASIHLRGLCYIHVRENAYPFLGFDRALSAATRHHAVGFYQNSAVKHRPQGGDIVRQHCGIFGLRAGEDVNSCISDFFGYRGFLHSCSSLCW